MTAPLSLSITPRKAAWLAGEGVIIDIDHNVHSDLSMETVELNRDRTQVVITPEGAPERAEVLTGLDHAALHKVSLLKPIGAAFQAPRGSAFQSYLELLLYRLPLAAGKYRIVLRYRYGDGPEAVVESNGIDIEIVPAKTVSAAHRWLAGANPRDQLGTMWVVDAGPAGQHWLHRTAAKHDPATGILATSFGPGRPASAAPVLAHLNDITAMHFARYVVWLEANSLGWQKIHAYGAASGPVPVSTGLAPSPPPALVDPPLQRRDGSLAVVVRGIDAQGRPALACIDQPADGPALWKSLPLPAEPIARAAVAWDADESGFRGRVLLVTGAAGGGAPASRVLVVDLSGGAPAELWSTQDRILELVVDQGLAQGHAVALARSQDAFLTKVWAVGSLGLAAEGSFPFADVALGESPPDPVDVVIRSGEPAVSLLFRGPDGWVVMHPGGRVVVSFEVVPATAEPRLVSTPKRGVFLLYPDPEVGFRSARAEP